MTREIKPNEVSIALMENSSDFIEKGLEAIISENEDEYKYAILHLYSGVLLFLKHILYKEHWTLIFENVDTADRNKLNVGDIKSVNYTTLLKRLEFIDRITITEKLKGDLNWMQKERNKIEHLHNNVNSHEVKSRIAGLLNDLIILISDHKESDENYSIDEYDHNYEYAAQLKMIQKYTFKFEDFISKRINIIKNDINKVKIVIICPTCNQNAVEINTGDRTTNCHFCLEKLGIDLFFNKYNPLIEEELYKPYHRLFSCPECFSGDIYKETYHNSICFNCFYNFDSFNLINCSKCYGIFESPNGEAGLCEPCLDNIMQQ